MQMTQKYWAVADVDAYSKSSFGIRLLNWNPKGLPEYMLVREDPYVITVDVPDTFDLRLAQADAVRGQIKKVQAQAQNEITRLTEVLNSILAIEG